MNTQCYKFSPIWGQRIEFELKEVGFAMHWDVLKSACCHYLERYSERYSVTERAACEVYLETFWSLIISQATKVINSVGVIVLWNKKGFAHYYLEKE